MKETPTVTYSYINRLRYMTSISEDGNGLVRMKMGL